MVTLNVPPNPHEAFPDDGDLDLISDNSEDDMEFFGEDVETLSRTAIVDPCPVAAMVDSHDNWDWAKLEPLFPHSILLHLSAKKSSLLGFTRDIPGWSRSHDRAFLVCSAYELLGGAAVEMSRHLFRECSVVVVVWGGLIKHDKWAEFMSMDVMAWSRLNLVSPSHFTNDLVDWDLRFGAIFWSLWLRRNTLIFDSDNLDSLTIMDRIRWLWEDMWAAFDSDCSLHVVHSSASGQTPISRATVCWSSPLVGWCKLNVNGVRDHATSFAACGGLICEHGGRWVRCFARSLGVCSPIEVELWAVHEGLVQAWVLCLKHVVVEVDSTLVLWLLSPHSRIVSSMTILQYISSFLS
ncbi:hypothetical protein V6N11_005044 [Hibiscus sabdariffa]|uniref:Uncharacterized protein n=2 Tax=Hibiscus sabdariffa TaxID=183260 RepID=A0ABR2N651_9ROSI